MKKNTFVFWSIFAAALIGRFAFSLHADIPDASQCLMKPIHGDGIISSDPERKETGQVYIVQFRTLTADGDADACAENLNVRAKSKLYPKFSYGDQVKVTGKLTPPYNFSSENGRSFDYKGFLAKDDVFYEIKSASVTLADDEKVNDLFSILFRIKHKFVSNIDRILGDPHSALAAGLVVGEKSALGKELIDDFRRVGLIHVVVLSGFNITIVAVALRRMLSFLPRIWGISIGGFGIILFGVLVGGGATVVRSCIMASIALIADLIRRDYNVFTALGFAAILMLIDNPLILLNDPSFQLSFLATLGLIILAKPIEEKLGYIPENFGLRGTVATTFATQIFVSPYILYMMGQISIIGVVVNILVLPLIPVTMLFVFLTGALGFIFEPLSMVAGWVTHFLLSYELFMVEKFADVPFAAAELPTFSIWWVVGFYSVLSIFFLFFKCSKQKIS